MITKRTNSDNPDFQEPVKALDLELKIRDGEDHAFYAALNKTDAIKHVIVMYDENRAVGCGSFKKYASKIMEIKRFILVSDIINSRKFILYFELLNFRY